MPIRRLLTKFDDVNRPFFLKIEVIEKAVLSLLWGHYVEYCEQDDTDCPILGMLEQVEFKLPGDDDCRIYNYIHYRKDISEKHRRFVFCKELIHILDPACYRTNNDVDVEELTIGMTTSNPIEEASPQAIHDRRSVVLAAAVFIPPSIREKLLPALETGEKTIQDISDFLKIPEEIVGSVFSKSWLTTFKYHMDRLNKDLDGEDEYDEPNSHNVVSEDVSSDA